MNVVPFEKQAVKDYLDACIRHWREERHKAQREFPEDIIRCYVDAYQSVRMSLFGDCLPLEEMPYPCPRY